MKPTIEEIIMNEQIDTLYQPIVNLITGEVMGYEALSRGPVESSFYSPIDLIESANEKGLTHELEYVLLKKAIENVEGLEASQRLFINVTPRIMIVRHPEIKEKEEGAEIRKIMEEKGLKPNNIVLELTERSMISDYEQFKEVLNYYKAQHYKIAIDDVGAGYSGLRTIRETQPHFIKIDMELIRDIDQDSFKEALIAAFLNFSITTNIRLIAEGIETENELSKLIEMGVHYGQGYLFQYPEKNLRRLDKDVIEGIKSKNRSNADMHLFRDAKDMIGSLINHKLYITADIDCMAAKHIIENNSVEGLTIIDEKNRPVGIIMRENLLTILSSRYGLSLYAKKPASHIMDIDLLMVDYHAPISEVSTKAMSRDRTKIYDIIVVTLEGEFYGTISINALLQHLITIETQMAKELNPLTRLPGNIIINRVLNDLILYKPACAVLYLDFDFFKPYNDIYGFESGDQFIKKVSEIIKGEIKTSLPYNSFIGHIGGDDFIFVMETSKEYAMEICERLIRTFEEVKVTFYAEEDYKKGYITAHDREGVLKEHPLVTLSISGIYNNLSHFQSVESLSRYMSDLKKQAKMIQGNSIVIEE